MADNISVKDAAAATVVVRAKDNTSVFLPVHAIADTTGANIASVDTGSALKISTTTKITSVTPTLDTSAYADGDTLFDDTVISACLRLDDGTGVITSVTVIDKDDQKQGVDLFFFDANLTTFGTANAAPSISDSDAGNFLGWVRIAAADYVDVGGVSIAQVPCSIPVKGVSGTDDLYVAGMSRGTGTYTASGMVIRVAIACD